MDTIQSYTDTFTEILSDIPILNMFTPEGFRSSRRDRNRRRSSSSSRNRRRSSSSSSSRSRSSRSSSNRNRSRSVSSSRNRNNRNVVSSINNKNINLNGNNRNVNNNVNAIGQGGGGCGTCCGNNGCGSCCGQNNLYYDDGYYYDYPLYPNFPPFINNVTVVPRFQDQPFQFNDQPMNDISFQQMQQFPSIPQPIVDQTLPRSPEILQSVNNPTPILQQTPQIPQPVVDNLPNEMFNQLQGSNQSSINYVTLTLLILIIILLIVLIYQKKLNN